LNQSNRISPHLRRIAARSVFLIALLLAASAPARAADGPSADDAARLLAGMSVPETSPLAPLTKQPAWQRHARFFDRAFAELEQRQLSKIRAFTASHLTASRPTMYYMFSGPDFLYADAFYGKATTYVLSALEPVGAVPDLSKLSPASVASSLAGVERATGTVLAFSFFITKNMKTELHKGQVSGVLPVLYAFLARSGKTLREVTPVTLDADGGFVAAGAKPGRGATHGVRITFAGADGVARTLYYFSTDLSNSGVKASGFLKFCATLAPGDSLIKSASYLLHSSNFSTVRDFLLQHSSTIIQDDSGIPLAAFDAKAWRFQPFGRYKPPIDKFPGRSQRRYVELFKGAPQIDFGIGYRWRPYETNLLLATKLPAP
jgi:hypothetical protein